MYHAKTEIHLHVHQFAVVHFTRIIASRFHHQSPHRRLTFCVSFIFFTFSSIAAPKTKLLCFSPLQIHLPFDEAVKWVRTTGVDFWGWKSKEDWLEWLQQGEGVSQYIPTNPESYYGPGGRGGGKEGVWRGWDYWLGAGEYKDQEI